MSNFELYNALLGLNMRQNVLLKRLKKLSKSNVKLSFLLLIVGILVLDHEKRLSKLEKIRVENLKNEFKKQENDSNWDDEIGKELD